LLSIENVDVAGADPQRLTEGVGLVAWRENVGPEARGGQVVAQRESEFAHGALEIARDESALRYVLQRHPVAGDGGACRSGHHERATNWLEAVHWTALVPPGILKPFRTKLPPLV